MFNNTIFTSLGWPADLKIAFRQQWTVMQTLHSFQLACIDQLNLPNWSITVHPLTSWSLAVYEDLLGYFSHNARISFSSALILVFCTLVTNLLLLRWLRGEQEVSKARSEEIRRIIKVYQQEREVSAKLNTQASIDAQTMVQLRSQLAQASMDSVKQRNVIVSQSGQISTLRNDLKGQKANAQNLTAAATKRNALLKTANSTIAKLQVDIAGYQKVIRAQTDQISTHDQEISGLKVENELLKAIDGRIPTISKSDRDTFSSFASPFVLVVIDGDAYAWNTSHFEQPGLSAGRYAAHAIKIEVQRYLLQNKDRVPLHSKIVTRVFTNLGDSSLMKSASVTFPRHFSESMPLFDFVNCGGGKERADSKIQELFHLFVANEHCHKIFFAAVTDNGFARLLEQYACIPAAKEKVVLIEPGFVAHEILDLQYKTVRWTTVFRHRMMDPESRAKAARIKLKRKNDSAVLKAVAARELVARLTDGVHVVSTTSPATASMGLGRTNWFGAQTSR